MKPGVAIVTGAGSGVGRVTAVRLAGAGWRVGLVGRTASTLNETAQLILEAGGRTAVAVATANVGDLDEVSGAFRAIRGKLGDESALICAAGVGLYGPVVDYSMEDWHTTIQTNLTGVFVCCRTSLPSLITQRGLIVAIGSGAGKQGYANLSAYSASKFGLLGFMQSLAAEVSESGVRACTINPGSILTNFGGRSSSEKERQRAEGKKYLDAEDVAGAIEFLIGQSDRAWTQELNLWPF